MKIISLYKLLLILITWTIHFSEQIKHINKFSSIDACKGKDVDLLWKVDEEKSKISTLEWYFNNTMICTSSPVEAFTVKPPYQGRIERIGKTEIRLKNLSKDDEGIYILHPLFDWSIADNMLKIELRILEPPINKCTCDIGYPPDSTSELTESYCGRPQVSFLWKRKQTFEVLGEGNPILNSTLQDKELLCCLDGEAMKCVDDKRQFCTTVSIPHRDTERPSEDGNTQRTDSVTMPGTGTGSTNIHRMQPFDLATVSLLTALLVLVLLVLALLVSALFIRNCKKRKNNTDVEEIIPMFSKVQESHADLNEVQVSEKPSPIRGTVQELDADLRLDQMQDDADTCKTSEFEEASSDDADTFKTSELEDASSDWPLQDSNQRVQNVNNISIDTDFLKCTLHSNTALTAELQASRKDDADTFKTSELEDASSDWPLQDSNQRVQNVNNISIDTDFLKCMFHSNTALTAELQASRKETRKLKRQFHQGKHLRKKENRSKYSFELTSVKGRYFKKNDADADTFKTSESEDASSDDADTFKTSELEDASSDDADTFKTSESEDVSSDDADTFKTSESEDASSDDADTFKTSESEDASSVAVKPKHSHTSLQGNEDLQQVPTVAATTEKPSPVMETVQEMDAYVKLDQMQIAVEPTHSNTVVQFNEDLQQFRTVAATTDWPLQDVNQRVQNVNNISIYTEFLKSILRLNPVLMEELQAGSKVAVKPTHSNTFAQFNENLQQVPTVAATTEKPSPIMETVQKLDADVKLDLIQDWPLQDSDQRVKNVNNISIDINVLKSILRSNPALMAELQAGRKDWPLQDSKQRVQNVNNISKDTAYLKSILRSNPALMAELQASSKETRKLKRQLHREKHLREKEHGLKYSFEMTPGKCRYFKKKPPSTPKLL